MNAYRLGILLLLITLCLTTSPALAQAPLEETSPPDPRFGIVETYLNAAEASAAGAGYSRIILRWDVIQPAGRDDWKPANVPDPFIEAELAAGRELVAVLIGTPSWASQGVNDSRAVPDMEAWGNFTKRIAQQYQGRIQHWVIWNEPDVWDSEHPGSTWLGSEEDYARLLEVAYGSIKQVDSSMQVHLAGLTYHWDANYDREAYLARLLRILTAKPNAEVNNHYFDAVGYHLYYNPRQIFDILQQVRSILDVHRLGHKPIWLNETNAPPSDDALEPPWAEPLFVVSSDEQAAFVIQSFAMALAGGAERVQVYKMRNSLEHPEDVEPFGLLRHDDSRRAAFDAYRVVTRHFAGFDTVSWFQQGEVYVVTLERGELTTTVLWNTARQPQIFTLNAIATETLLVDEVGNETNLPAENGTYRIELPAATCSAGFCFIGGAPRVLVEQGRADQRASLIPLATETPTPTPLPTATATPSPTARPTLPPTATAVPTSVPTPTSTPTSVPTASESGQSAPPAAIAFAGFTQNADEAAAMTPPAAPAGFSLAGLFRPERLVILVVIGAILFTIIYVIQFRIWSRRHR